MPRRSGLRRLPVAPRRRALRSRRPRRRAVPRRPPRRLPTRAARRGPSTARTRRTGARSP
ncbi:MAG: hypothetical protein EVA89_34615 [Sandaracinaceae bacterium]|nr:MAG: hypothetical protein EVA89_34615 [Sandaracinaceae bacterium]